MRWNRRVAVTSSTVTGIALAAAILAVMKPQFLNNGVPSQAVVASRVLAGPIDGVGGARLVRQVTRPALVINPAKVSPMVGKHLAQSMGIKGLGEHPLLWLAPPGLQKQFSKAEGVTPVKAQVWEPRPGLGAGAVHAVAKVDDDLTRGPWVLSRGEYRPARTGPTVRTALNVSLSREIQADIHGSGAAVVASGNGGVQALAAAGGGPSPLWQSQDVGMALLPPELALALKNSSVRQKLDAQAVSLQQIGQTWGDGPMAQGLSRLGIGTVSLKRSPEHVRPLSAKVSAAALTQGTGIVATPEEIARSYLPFVDNGKLPLLSLGRAAGSPLTVRGAFSETLAQIPRVTEGGVTFRVWRPAGNFAIIVAPAQHRVAVLEGALVQDTLPVMQLMAQNRS